MKETILRSTDHALQDVCTSLRHKVSLLISSGHRESALFFADKLVCLSSDNIEDIVQYIQILIDINQSERAHSFITSRHLANRSRLYRYLDALALFRCRKYDQVLKTLDNVLKPQLSLDNEVYLKDTLSSWNIDSCEQLLYGKAFEASGNKAMAAKAFRKALKSDVYNFEALESVLRHSFITTEQEKALIDSLSFEAQCGNTHEASLLEFLYMCKLNEKAVDYSTMVVQLPASLKSNTLISKRLDANTTVLLAAASRLYNLNMYSKAYEITSKILLVEKLNQDCLALHVCLMLEMRKTNELFTLAHQMVDNTPEDPLSWFAVGCYYYSIENYDLAKRYLAKCTQIEPDYASGWLLYGHSFACEQEHDQSMNCYIKAAKIMKHCHLATLYIGMEYCLTKNTKLAEKFLEEAKLKAPNDPYVKHEIAVCEYLSDKLFLAIDSFLAAFAIIENSKNVINVGQSWEPLLNNIAHCYRKQGQYEKALEFHHRALLLCPRSSSTLAAMALCNLMLKRFCECIECCHQSLAVNPDNKNVSVILERSVVLMLEYDQQESTWQVNSLEKPSNLEPVPLSYRKKENNSLRMLDESTRSALDSSIVMSLRPRKSNSTTGPNDTIESSGTSDNATMDIDDSP